MLPSRIKHNQQDGSRSTTTQSVRYVKSLKEGMHCCTLILIYWLIDWDGGGRVRTAVTNAPIVHPRVICEHGETWWWLCWLGITPDSSTRALLQSYKQRHLGQVGNGRRSENFAYQYLKYLKVSLTCRKILRHGTSGFTSHPNKVTLILVTCFASINI
jgi:hypothetical protein